ncbi:glycine N-acyltransferase [Grammomys surdaster]|uniref:glycine N-acyltransferase n=1 Tax=Grammomys surdaster TaxID=491861 RepID=UPI00109FA4A9|nr:glycine N-acyltransferase [Grammomys surdaster]
MAVLLQGAQMLQTLEKSLRKCLPESLKVYGTVYHMIHGNPFNLKALVDKWPDFNTVVIRPQEQEMADELDCYTSSYQIYSKDPENCQEFLDSSEVINWKQHLQIQSSQSHLNKTIQNLASIQSFQIKHSENILYVTLETIKKLFPSALDTKNLSPGIGKPKAINQDIFKLSSLDVAHAALVDKFWFFGGNERSQRYIERLIKTFPSSCVLGPEGTPASWTLMDQTGEIRMGGTLPEYRNQGLVSFVVYSQEQAMKKRGFPVYSHTTQSNTAMQKMSYSLQHLPMPCAWNQWRCMPM